MGSLCSSSESLLTVAVLVGKAVKLSLTALHLAERKFRAPPPRTVLHALMLALRSMLALRNVTAWQKENRMVRREEGDASGVRREECIRHPDWLRGLSLIWGYHGSSPGP